MSFLKRLFSASPDREALQPLYSGIIALARQPHWYVEGKVPDTLDGRFDMIAAVLSIVLLRFEQENDERKAEAALLAEVFVNDMDAQLRQIGIGDLIVGKHVGKMMSALGGRIGAYRNALVLHTDTLDDVLVRNLYRGEAPGTEALAYATTSLTALHAEISLRPIDAVLKGRISDSDA